ncbi:MAG: extracellular solute-binding protein, partial [Clostridia bacterium]|nr:extracellular solute-binding protein [Clostridia bacterium]
MRKLALWMTVLIFPVSACVPAFASTGDRVLMHDSSLADVGTMFVEDVLPCGNGLYLIVNDQQSRTVRRYADLQAEPEEYKLDGEEMPAAPEEEEPVTINIIDTWFVRGEELYALTENMTIGGEENRAPELFVNHVKLADGKVILEESDLPELDLSGLLMEDGENIYTKGVHSGFTAGDKLFLHIYGDGEDELLVIDLRDGTGTAIELDDDVNEIAPGPEGSVLMTRFEWEADSTVTVRISRLDPADRSETVLAKLEGLTFTRIAPNYSAEKDTLYYYKAGELWAMPHFDAAQAEAVNDCPDNGNGSFLLPNGFVVIWTYDTVMARNTDPAQRSSVTLHVMEFADGMAVTEALYEMNNQRGDISVVEQRDWSKKKEILRAMLNRDSSTDIYLYEYDSNEFQALYNRDYLPDLSGNAKIAESTDRLYPYLQEAVRQNGKIIGVPVNLWGYVPGIHMEQWKEIGGTEEELPKTWSQFFAWLESLPERIEGKDVYLAPWADRVSFRTDILEIMLNQYEIRMEKKG